MSDLFSTSIVNVIQLAIAPVFLLAGVSAFLTVLINRLGRIVDRARSLREGHTQLSSSEREELRILGQRIRLINLATSLSSLSALLVCLVVMALFVYHFMVFVTPAVIASLFIGAMSAQILSLLLFQGEIYLAIKTVRIIQL
jgi:hypothetical protein